VTYFRG